MDKAAYCLWQDKFIVDFTEHDLSVVCCNVHVEYCEACDFCVFKDRSNAFIAHEVMNAK